ncbi:hypothetical protein ACLOJK_019840 [Asimina triloba]
MLALEEQNTAKNTEMGFGVLRSILRPLSQRAQISGALSHFRSVVGSSSPPPLPKVGFLRSVFTSLQNSSSTPPLPWTGMMAMGMHSLTDIRFPKRRPSNDCRRKRASLRPPGPYAWVQYVPGEPIPRSRPNEGSVQGRNRKKRIKQHKEFIKVFDIHWTPLASTENDALSSVGVIFLSDL